MQVYDNYDAFMSSNLIWEYTIVVIIILSKTANYLNCQGIR